MNHSIESPGGSQSGAGCVQTVSLDKKKGDYWPLALAVAHPHRHLIGGVMDAAFTSQIGAPSSTMIPTWWTFSTGLGEAQVTKTF